MKDKTWFEGATFKTVPPEFFGAELHEGTVWPGGGFGEGEIYIRGES